MMGDRYSLTSYITNAAVAIFGAWNFEYAMMLIGASFAAATYLTSRHYQKRRDAREAEELVYKRERAEREKELHALNAKSIRLNLDAKSHENNLRP